MQMMLPKPWGTMKYIESGFVLACALFYLCSNNFALAKESEDQQAVLAAEVWLALVDCGKYELSWDASADYFKTAVDKAQWVKSLKAFRKPLGSVVSRKIKSSQHATNLPGAPDGEYLVIQYDTSFEHKKSTVETVTPMRDKGGQWRVSGYYIK